VRECGLLRQGIYLLLRKIDTRFCPSPQVDKSSRELLYLPRELAFKGTHRRAHSAFGAGIDQIGNTFSLSQIELAIEECTAREFPRLRDSRAQF
jgi:hypothetical protein